jgi:hypothetical protein
VRYWLVRRKRAPAPTWAAHSPGLTHLHELAAPRERVAVKLQASRILQRTQGAAPAFLAEVLLHQQQRQGIGVGARRRHWVVRACGGETARLAACACGQAGWRAGCGGAGNPAQRAQEHARCGADSFIAHVTHDINCILL